MTNVDFKSEIRDSTLRGLEEKVAKSSYNSYLKRVTLKKLRGFTDRAVTFDFPVTALVGPNGGGKTTVLGAAAIAYKDIAPGTFFAKSGKYDASMQNWSIEYELIEKSLNPKIPVPRTASFPKLKWNRTAVNRPTLLFGVSRTLPATERRELSRAVGNNFVAASSVKLDPTVISYVGRILDKELTGCNRLSIDASGRATLFALSTPGGNDYSEFHFGAGEASVIRIVGAVEEAPENSLILIEEIENGLHPVATRRIVEYLIGVAERKSCQVIFTTHSNDALAPLPAKAIWAAYDGEVLQGKLDIRALRTITSQIDARLAIFVEDRFAELMVQTALRYTENVEMDAIKIHSMGGEAPARKVNEQHNIDPTSKFPSIAILDGDQGSHISTTVLTLPGVSDPETHVFDAVFSRLETVAARLAVSLQLPPSSQERVKERVTSRALTNHDRHTIFEQIGEDLDFTSGHVVASAFLAMWAQEYPEEVTTLVDGFRDRLPLRSNAAARRDD